MLIIYSTKITNRLKYTVDLIFNSIIKTEYTLTDNKTEYTAYNGPKINYSNKPISAEELYIYAHEILFDKGIKYYHEEFTGEGEHAMIFKNKSKSEFNFDVFGATFLLVSRYEEYLPHKKDRLHRYKPENSFAYKNDFLQFPLVNIWALKIAELLKSKFEIHFDLGTYKYTPTIDIDNAWAYKNKGFARIFSALTNELLSFNFEKFSNRIKVLRDVKKDPYDTYHILNNWANKYKIQPIYFFLIGDYDKYDKSIPFENVNFQNLIKTVSTNSKVGMHPSFASNRNPKKIIVEKERLESITEKPITKSRQHFIKLTFPDTYNNLIENGIRKDYSMGYATKIGFRASICTPFYFYNLVDDKQTNLLIYPFQIMDTTLKHYLKFKPENTLEGCLPIINQVKKVNGELITIFHNDSLSEMHGWQKWQETLESIIEEALK
jgi:hypothetical protein